MRVLPVLVPVILASGCAALPHPAALSGQWVDSLRTSAADTSVWILAPNGDDLSLRLVHDASARAEAVSTRPERYGRWYLKGALDDVAGRALCFTRRPGRDAPSCVAFVLDTITVAGTPRRRLFLRAYESSHGREDRVLLERSQ